MLILLPKPGVEVKNKNPDNNRIHSNRHWAWKTRAYLHRFQLADDPMCPCKEAQQTSNHIIFECNILEAQRGSMIKTIVCSGGSWPPAKDEMTNKYIQAFASFVKSIDFQTL